MQNTKSLYLRISLFFYLVYVFIPMTRALPTIVKAAFIGFAILFLILDLLTTDKRYFGETILTIFGIIIINYLIYFGIWRANPSVELVSKMLMLFVFWMPILYIKPILNTSERTTSFLLKLLVFLVLIESATTIVGNMLFPMASRILASPLDVDQNRFFQLANIGGYGFIYSLVMSIPLIVYKQKNSKEIIFTILAIIVLATILVASYMTAMVFTLVMAYLSYSITSKRGLFFGLLVAAFVFLFSDFLLNGLLDLSKSALESDNYILSERFASIHEYITEGSTSGDMGYRDELRNSSWDAFRESPITGNLFSNFHFLGLHSEFIDMLGGIGIFGVLIIFVVFRSKLSYLIKLANKTAIKYYLIIALLGIFAFSFTNVVTTAPEVSALVIIMGALFLNQYYIS